MKENIIEPMPKEAQAMEFNNLLKAMSSVPYALTNKKKCVETGKNNTTLPNKIIKKT